MKKRIHIFFYPCFFLTSIVSSQEYSIQKLNIGDAVPNVEINDIINYKKERINVSAFKGKILILDLWSITCLSCIQDFPKYSTLQKKYRDDIVIMPIAFTQTKEAVMKFYEKRKKLAKEIAFPTGIYSTLKDNVFYKLFPIIEEGFPALIWIDRNGILIGITNSLELNGNNIQKLINGELVTLKSRQKQRDFNFYKPLLINNNGGSDSSFSYRSMITPYSDSIGGYLFVRQKTEHFIRFFVPNQSVAGLLQECLYKGRNKDIHNKRLILESKRELFLANGLTSEENDKDIFDKKYCYELILPSSFSLEDAYRFMYQDICRYFGVSAQLEKRELPCLVIQHRKNGLKSKNHPSVYNVSKDGLDIQLVNRSINDLMSLLDRDNYPIIINETNPDSNIDITVTIPEHYDFKRLANSFGQFDIELSETKRSIEVLVIQSSHNKLLTKENR